jgi:hypothetical protein
VPRLPVGILEQTAGDVAAAEPEGERRPEMYVTSTIAGAIWS